MANYVLDYSGTEVDTLLDSISPLTRAQIIDIIEDLYPSATSSEVEDMADGILADYSTVTEDMIETILLGGAETSIYASIDSPAFTGTPTAPTPNSETNNTQIATTAFVKTALSGKENISNKVTSLSSNSTDTQYPSAKLLYDQLALKQNAGAASSINITDTTPESATSYYLAYVTSRDNNQILRANTDLYYYDTGTASYLNVGSSTNTGGLTLHQSNSKYINLVPKSGIAANRTIYLPDENGTLATVEYTDKKRKIYTTTSVRASYAGASGEAPRYLPGKWSISAGADPIDGNVYVIKVPSAGTTSGQYLSVNGTDDEDYHPIVLRGASRLTTQFEADAYVELIYEENKTVTVYELNATAQNNGTVSYTGGVFRVLNYYDANTNTLLRTYALTKDAEFPLIGASTATSGTPDTHTSSYKDSYGMIPSAAANKATINLSTGKVTIPSGLNLGTSSSKLGSIVFRNATNAYTTTINSGAPTANKTITLPTETGTLALLASPAFTGTPTAPTAAAGTNTTQIATTAFVQAAVNNSSGGGGSNGVKVFYFEISEVSSGYSVDSIIECVEQQSYYPEDFTTFVSDFYSYIHSEQITPSCFIVFNSLAIPATYDINVEYFSFISYVGSTIITGSIDMSEPDEPVVTITEIGNGNGVSY